MQKTDEKTEFVLLLCCETCTTVFFLVAELLLAAVVAYLVRKILSPHAIATGLSLVLVIFNLTVARVSTNGGVKYIPKILAEPAYFVCCLDLTILAWLIILENFPETNQYILVIVTLGTAAVGLFALTKKIILEQK